MCKNNGPHFENIGHVVDTYIINISVSIQVSIKILQVLFVNGNQQNNVLESNYTCSMPHISQEIIA